MDNTQFGNMMQFQAQPTTQGFVDSQNQMNNYIQQAVQQAVQQTMLVQQQAVPEVGLARGTMSIDDKIAWSKLMSQGDMVPKQYQDKPANVMYALEYAEAVGVPAINALTSISVVNGKPGPSTDLMVTLARRAGHKVWTNYDAQTGEATCIIHRKDEEQPRPPVVWDKETAKTAGLWGKTGPWTQYPSQMLKWRAQSDAIRTHCVEVLNGASESAEEMRDRMDAERRKVQATRQDGQRSRLERAKAATPEPQQVQKPEPQPELPAKEPQQEQPAEQPQEQPAQAEQPAEQQQELPPLDTLAPQERHLLKKILAEQSIEALEDGWRAVNVLPGCEVMRAHIKARAEELKEQNNEQ